MGFCWRLVVTISYRESGIYSYNIWQIYTYIYRFSDRQIYKVIYSDDIYIDILIVRYVGLNFFKFV